VGEHAGRLALHEIPEEIRPQVLSQTNALEIELDHAATVEEVKRLYNAIGRIAKELGFNKDDLPIIPTRQGLRVLNFASDLDGAEFAGVISRAVAITLGERKIFPLKIADGDLVSNLWKEKDYANGEAYLQKLLGHDSGGTTTVTTGRTHGGVGGDSHDLGHADVASGGPPDISGRVVDIYDTVVRAIEQRYYEWFRELVRLAQQGQWESIPLYLRRFVREELLPILYETAEGSAVETAESHPDIILPQEEGAVQPVAAQDVAAGANVPPTAGEGAPTAAVPPEAGGAAPTEPQATPPGAQRAQPPSVSAKQRGRPRRKPHPSRQNPLVRKHPARQKHPLPERR
jgi:hypothetical protein